MREELNGHNRTWILGFPVASAGRKCGMGAMLGF
jgi:hypothetical protein